MRRNGWARLRRVCEEGPCFADKSKRASSATLVQLAMGLSSQRALHKSSVARTHMKTSLSFDVFRSLVVPHCKTVLPANFCENDSVTVATAKGAAQIGEIREKIK